MQELIALIEYEVTPGVTSNLTVFGTIDPHGQVVWDDSYQILKDKGCKFLVISVINERDLEIVEGKPCYFGDS